MSKSHTSPPRYCDDDDDDVHTCMQVRGYSYSKLNQPGQCGGEEGGGRGKGQGARAMTMDMDQACGQVAGQGKWGGAEWRWSRQILYATSLLDCMRGAKLTFNVDRPCFCGAKVQVQVRVRVSVSVRVSVRVTASED